MSAILVDSSVWIEYFQNGESPVSAELDRLIDHSVPCLNDLVLAELIPSLLLKKQRDVVNILMSLERFSIRIEWDEIISLQTRNLKAGINKVGIPDLIILQNALQNEAALFTLDKHFRLMQKHAKLKLHVMGSLRKMSVPAPRLADKFARRQTSGT